MHESSMLDDNSEKQNDEVSAMSAIYGDEFVEESTAERIYVVHLHGCDTGPARDVNLKFTLPKTYPTDCPPVYEIHAPWIERSAKQALHDALQDIYLDNIGEPVLFLWTEKVREFLSCLPPPPSEDSEEENVRKDQIKQEVEVETTRVCPKIFHGEPLIDRKSVFQAHVANINSTMDVQSVKSAVLQNKKVANATHNIVAYRFMNEAGMSLQDCDDDGETAAGGRLLHLLNILNVNNTIVIVTRWYGGIHLGPDRFKHINNVARRALSEHGFLQ